MEQAYAGKERQLQVVQNEKDEMEIDLLEIAYHLLDHWKLILVCFLVGTIIMAGATAFLMEPMYEATSKMYVLSSSDSVVNLSDLQLGTYLASDYQEVFATHEVTEKVIEKLGLPYSYARLQDMLRISNPSGTRILDITVTSGDPEEAAAISNEFLEVASQYVADVMITDRPTVLSTALVPKEPVSPSMAKNVVLGALAGVVLACGYLIVQFLLDDKIKNAEDITKLTGLPILSEVPFFSVTRTQQNADHAVKATAKQSAGKEDAV